MLLFIISNTAATTSVLLVNIWWSYRVTIPTYEVAGPVCVPYASPNILADIRGIKPLNPRRVI